MTSCLHETCTNNEDFMGHDRWRTELCDKKTCA